MAAVATVPLAMALDAMGGGDLTSLDWLGLHKLSLTPLEVDGDSIRVRSNSNAGKGGVSVSKGVVRANSGGRRRTQSASAGCSSDSDTSDGDEVTEFLAKLTGNDESNWSQFSKKNSTKKNNDKPQYSLECFVALAMRSMPRAATPPELASCIRSKLPYYAKRSKEELMTSVTGTLRRSSHFAETTPASNTWVYSHQTSAGGPSKQTSAPLQRRRSCGKKAGQKRNRSKSTSSAANVAEPPTRDVQWRTQMRHSGRVNRLSSQDEDNAGALLDDSLLLDMPRRDSFSSESAFSASDSAILSDGDIDLTGGGICQIPMEYGGVSMVSMPDDVDLGIASSPDYFAGSVEDGSPSWMPTTYIPGCFPRANFSEDPVFI